MATESSAILIWMTRPPEADRGEASLFSDLKRIGQKPGWRSDSPTPFIRSA